MSAPEASSVLLPVNHANTKYSIPTHRHPTEILHADACADSNFGTSKKHTARFSSAAIPNSMMPVVREII